MCTERQRGLTLVELVVFMVIVAIAMAGVLGVLAYSNRNSADAQAAKQALAIAEGLLEEVEQAHFTFCDPADANAETAGASVINSATIASCATTMEMVKPESGNTRPFDNINDYVKAISTTTQDAPNYPFNDTGDASGNLVDAAGNAVYTSDGKNTLGTYKASVRIYSDEALGPSGNQIAALHDSGNPANSDVLRISVTVSYANNRSVTLDGYRTRYAPNSLP